MKKLLILSAFISLILVSCSKPNDIGARPSANTESKIEFSLYNSLETYYQVNASAVTKTGVKVYSFVGTKNPVAENIFSMTFMTDSLRPGTYDVNTGVVNFREGNKIVTNAMSSNFTVTITSNVNGLVNGTFAGNLYDHSTSSNCTVVSGLIENIQLSYK